MRITKKGKYELLEDFLTRNSVSGGKLSAGKIITITQVDLPGHKVIGPSLTDWTPDEMPVQKIS